MLQILDQAYQNKKSSVVCAPTKAGLQVLDILWQYGFLRGYTEETPSRVKILLKYAQGKSVISSIFFSSRPTSCSRWTRRGQASLVILSTPKGIMSESTAQSLGSGGSLICEVF